MTTCPDCGRENLQEPAGHVAPCGRRVGWNDAPGVLYPHPDQWRDRMRIAQACRISVFSSTEQRGDG